MTCLTETTIAETGSRQTGADGPVLLIPEAGGHKQRRHRRRAIVVIALAFGVAAILSVGSVFLRGSDNASDSGPASPAQLRAESAACQSFWTSATDLSSHISGGGLATLPAVTVSDVRGSYAALLYMGSHGSVTCFLSSPSSVVGIEGGDGSFSRTPTATNPVTLSSPSLFTNVGAKFQLVEGQAAPNVRSVTLTLSDGTVVHPTLSGGYLLGFWPGTTSAVSSSYRIGKSVHQSGGAPLSPAQLFGDQLPSG